MYKIAIIEDDGTINIVGTISDEPIDYDVYEDTNYEPEWEYNTHNLEEGQTDICHEIVRTIRIIIPAKKK